MDGLPRREPDRHGDAATRGRAGSPYVGGTGGAATASQCHAQRTVVGPEAAPVGARWWARHSASARDDGRLGGQVVRTVQAAPGAELPLWLRSPWVGGDHLAHTFCVGVSGGDLSGGAS